MRVSSSQKDHFLQPNISNGFSESDSPRLQDVRERAIVVKLDADINNKITRPDLSIRSEPTDIPTASLSENRYYDKSVNYIKSGSETVMLVDKASKPDKVEEPLLKENPRRFVLFPIEDEEVSSLRKVSNLRRVK